MSDLHIKSEQAIKIAELNDEFRQNGKWMVTPSILLLPDVHGLYMTIKEYSSFTEDNDPYGEHDFGSLDWFEEKVFWKIDYYDTKYARWYDPLSTRCVRVLTVYLACEH